MSLNTLDGKVTPKEFVEFLENNLPHFFQYNIDREHSLIETMRILHHETFCNDEFLFNEKSDLDGIELSKYLHSLKLSVSRAIDRMEVLYCGL